MDPDLEQAMTTAAPALFILCTMRSYSSLICTMLGQHPELYGLPEINLAVADDIDGVLAFYQRRAHGLHGLVRVVAQLQSGVQSDASVADAAAWIEARRDWTTGRMLGWIADHLAPRRLVDKSPVTVRSVAMMQRLHAMAPDAQFLHITRQPAAVCRSINTLHAALDAQNQTSLRTRVDAEQVWASCNANILAFKETLAPGLCLTLRGEDFLADFATYAPQVCDWLGIDAGAAALAAMLNPQESVYACPGPETARYGNDPNFLEHPAFTPRPIPIEDVEDGVDGVPFKPATRKLARLLGYA